MEAVIGLEVHVELATATKMFCGCANEFGAEPNTHVCPVCLGLPGSLPVLNAQAVELVLRFAEAVHLQVPAAIDLRRARTTSIPTCRRTTRSRSTQTRSRSTAGSRSTTRASVIERAHLEEDTGKTLHVGGGGRIHEASYSLVDYNRAGVPLMEIVSRPDIRSAEQARAYVSELRGVLEAVGVSDVKFEEGSMRVDANVSVRPRGTTELGVKVEVKNMNSLRSLGRAIDYEIERQVAAIAAGERDRAGDASLGRRRRPHELDAQQGRLVATTATSPSPTSCPSRPTTRCGRVSAASMPELPAMRRARLVEEWGIPESDGRILVATPGLADYAEAAVAALHQGTAKDVANWCIGDVLAHLNESGLSPAVLPLAPDGLAELVDLVADGTLSRNQAKDVLAECLAEPKRPKQVVAERGLAQVSDEGELVAVIDGIVAANPSDVDDYRNGDDKVRKKKHGFFMGEAMKATKGQGNPQVLTRLIRERLGASLTHPRDFIAA